MLPTQRHLAPIVAAIAVAGPLAYFHFVGRPYLYSPEVESVTTIYRYGWPSVYGERRFEQQWGPKGGRRVGPLDDFNGLSLFWNSIVAAAMIAGTVGVTQRTAAALRERQFSLRQLLLLPVAVAGVYAFVRYDRSPDLIHFLVAEAPAPIESSFRSIHRPPQAITSFPPYLFLPILFGVAAGVFAGLSAGATLVVRLCRVAYRGSAGSSARSLQCRALAILTLLGVVGAATFLARTVYRVRTVSHAAVFGKFATDWATLYVMAHDGQWPRSWDMLRECVAAYDPKSERMIEKVQSYIEIDFDADPQLLAAQTAEEFHAIRSLDGYGVDHREYWGVDTLIDMLGDPTIGVDDVSPPQNEWPPAKLRCGYVTGKSSGPGRSSERP
jgi:hypothetical protein